MFTSRISKISAHVGRGAIISLACAAILAGCATQRYGRAVPVSDAESRLLTCESIELEMAKNDAFLEDVRMQRSQTTAAHVFGALGDFGIGNVMEGDAAEQSAIERRSALQNLKAQKNC